LLDVMKTPQGVIYWQVTGWHHQRIDKPQESKIQEGSKIDPDAFQEYSGNTPGAFPPYRIGKDRKGKDRKGDSSVVEHSTTEPPQPEPTTFLVFPIVGDAEDPWWVLTIEHRDRLQELYPTLDVTSECRKALARCEAGSPKTRRGMPKYLANWMNRATERSPGRYQGNGSKEPDLDAIDAEVDRRRAERWQPK
jgi:hypothetical protein